jgi:hypothetical protein
LDSGYKLTDLKTYDFEEEIKTTLGSSLHNFHGYVNSSIESLIYSWNEEGKEEDKFLSILDQPSDSAKLIMLGKKISN